MLVAAEICIACLLKGPKQPIMLNTLETFDRDINELTVSEKKKRFMIVLALRAQSGAVAAVTATDRNAHAIPT